MPSIRRIKTHQNLLVETKSSTSKASFFAWFSRLAVARTRCRLRNWCGAHGLRHAHPLTLANQLLSSSLLVILALCVVILSRKSVNFVLVFIYLSLTHVELRSNSFHLPRPFLQCLLIRCELLCHFWTRLASQYVLQLYVQPLFFFNDEIF